MDYTENFQYYALKGLVSEGLIYKMGNYYYDIFNKKQYRGGNIIMKELTNEYGIKNLNIVKDWKIEYIVKCYNNDYVCLNHTRYCFYKLYDGNKYMPYLGFVRNLKDKSILEEWYINTMKMGQGYVYHWDKFDYLLSLLRGQQFRIGPKAYPQKNHKKITEIQKSNNFYTEKMRFLIGEIYKGFVDVTEKGDTMIKNYYKTIDNGVIWDVINIYEKYKDYATFKRNIFNDEIIQKNKDKFPFYYFNYLKIENVETN